MIVKIALLLTIGLMTVPVFAETISPLKQFQMGIPLDMIECSDGKILMKFPSGKPACVTSKTSEKLETRGFVLVVSNSPKIDNMANPNKSTHSEISEASSFLRIHDVKFELHGYPVVGETDELTLTLKHVDSYGFYEDKEGKLTPAPYEDTFGSLKPVKLNLLGAGEHPEYRLYDIVSNIGSDDPDIFTSYDHATETIIAELGKTYIVKAKVEILKEGFVNFFATTLDDEYIGLSYVISADESMSYREYKKHNETYLDHLLPVRKEFNSEPEPKLTEEPQPPPPGYVEPPPRSFTNKDLKQIAREFVHHKYTEDEMVHDFYAMRFSNQEITDFLKKYMNYTQTQINTFPIESELHTQSSVTG